MEMLLYGAACVLIAVISFMYGKSEGKKDGILEYYNADEEEKFCLLMDTRE